MKKHSKQQKYVYFSILVWIQNIKNNYEQRKQIIDEQINEKLLEEFSVNKIIPRWHAQGLQYIRLINKHGKNIAIRQIVSWKTMGYYLRTNNNIKNKILRYNVQRETLQSTSIKIKTLHYLRRMRKDQKGKLGLIINKLSISSQSKLEIQRINKPNPLFFFPVLRLKKSRNMTP